MFADGMWTGGRFASSYGVQQSRLGSAMAKLSSGDRFHQLEDASADLGISQRFRAEIGAAAESSRNLQNAVSRLQATDSYVQSAQDIVGRMSELAVAAADGSKSAEQRRDLGLEMSQLKQEIARMSEGAKYDDVQIATDDTVVIWDAVAKQMVYAQSDGTELKAIDIDMTYGNVSANGVEYGFESATGVVGNFLVTNDGNHLLYVAQHNGTGMVANRTIMNLDLRTNTISTYNTPYQTSLNNGVYGETELQMDEQGRVWFSEPSNFGWSPMRVGLLDTQNMTADYGGSGPDNTWAGMNTALAIVGAFAANEGSLYYVDDNLNIVKQSMNDINDIDVLVSSDALLNIWSEQGYDRYTFGLLEAPIYTPGSSLEYEWLQGFSGDGRYVAMELYDIPSGENNLIVLDTTTGEHSTYMAGDDVNSIVSVNFDSNNNIYWTATGNNDLPNKLYKGRIEEGSSPLIRDINTVRNSTGGRLGASTDANAVSSIAGFSVSASGIGKQASFRNATDSIDHGAIERADLSLRALGISTVRLDTMEDAQQSITSLQRATDRLSRQRAGLGAQIRRMSATIATNDNYGANIGTAESRIRDTDVATQTVKMAAAQMLAQLNISVIAQDNGRANAINQLIG